MPESPASPTPYEVLGVSATASQQELRRAYRRLLRQVHPDTGGDPVRFHAVQLAWERVGRPAARTAYDRGTSTQARSTAAPDAEHAPFARPAGTRTPRRHAPRARSYGHPGGAARERYLTLIREWAGRGRSLDDPYDPAVVRAAPPELRHLLAKALAEEATARTVSALGIGYTIWNNVQATSGHKIDHIVLGPAGLFAIQSEDWGGEVRMVKGDVAGGVLPPKETPITSLVRAARKLARSLGVRFSGFAIVVPDDALANPVTLVERGRHAGSALLGRSLLPEFVRTGLSDAESIGVADIFEVRTRLQNGIRFV